MKKYEVIKETVEAKLSEVTLTTTSLLDYAANLEDHDGRVLASFSSLEEALAVFEVEKENCSSRILRTTYSYILFDYLKVEANEYDEDGEWIDGYGTYDEFVRCAGENEEEDDD